MLINYFRHLSLVGVTITAFAVSNASAEPIHSRSLAEQLQAQKQNRLAEKQLPLWDSAVIKERRPFAEYEKAGWVVFSDQNSFQSGQIKETIARNLPSGVKLFLTSKTEYEAQGAKRKFANYLNESLITAKAIPNGVLLWARDTSPVAIFEKIDGKETVAFVETRHRGGHEIAPFFQAFFKWVLISSEFDYPGGNLLADTKGNCFQIRSSRGFLSDAALKSLYGCRVIHTLPHRYGIGDVDEVLKLTSDKDALTVDEEIRPLLESLGYSVTILPRPRNNRNGTYANSLLVNGRLFMPSYGVEEDKVAEQIYQNLGLEVFTAPSNELSGVGLGSIHCITMSYPEL